MCICLVVWLSCVNCILLDHHTLANALILSTLCCCCGYSVLFYLKHFHHYVWYYEFPSCVFVVGCWMMFCPVISVIGIARSPMYSELLLALYVS